MAKKNKSINIANDDEFRKLPQEMRSQTMYKLHEMWLESAMHGGYIDGLLKFRDDGEDLTRHAVVIVHMGNPGFPPEMKTEGEAAYHREMIDLDKPPAWVMGIEPIAKRIAETAGRKPQCTWYLPPDAEGEESKTEMRDADMWGITCADNRAVLQAIDLDTMLDRVTERAKVEQSPPQVP